MLTGITASIATLGNIGNVHDCLGDYAKALSCQERALEQKEALGDKAEVQAFGSSQLGKDKELLQKLKLGQITFSLPSSVMSSVLPARPYTLPIWISESGSQS